MCPVCYDTAQRRWNSRFWFSKLYVLTKHELRGVTCRLINSFDIFGHWHSYAGESISEPRDWYLDDEI